MWAATRPGQLISDGQKRQPFRQDNTFAAKHVVGAAISLDALNVVYELSETLRGTEDTPERQVISLWLLNIKTGQSSRLTPKGVSATNPQFDPDGKSVLYLSPGTKVTSRNQVFRQSLDATDCSQISDFTLGVDDYSLSPDGRYIAFVVREPPAHLHGEGGHVRITRQHYRFDAIKGYLHDNDQGIVTLDLQKQILTQQIQCEGLISSLEWSPDGREIAFIRNAGRSSSYFAMIGDLCVVSASGKLDTLVRNQLIQLIFWSPDGRYLGYCSSPDTSLTRQSQLWVLPRNGGNPVCRTALLDCSVPASLQINNPGGGAPGQLAVSSETDAVYVSAGMGGQSEILRIPIHGGERCRVVVDGQRTCKVFGLAGEKLLFGSQDCLNPSELHLLDLVNGEERRLTDHNSSWQQHVEWPVVKHQQIATGGVVPIETWVLHPPGISKPNKTILFIHGGPHASFTWAYHEDMHELVGEGYTLVFANPRGSSGYGDAFSQAIVGCWGKPEFEDFNAILDELVHQQVVDPDRVGVTGVSGGGHLCAWLTCHSQRFKAAIPEQGIYNMFSAFGVSDVGTELISAEMGGEPHECPDRYWALSPVAHAHKCRTPTLLIQGEDDVRCPMQQAEELYTVLRRNGCQAELLRLRKCNHLLEVTGHPPLRRFRMNAIKEWFARHIPDIQ